jgi:fucose permease
MAPLPERIATPLAAGLIMVAFFGGWFLMPPLMRLVSGGGPVVGSLVGLVFVLAFFAVFWLRTRYQRRKGSG